MDIEPKYSFVYLPNKKHPGLENKNTQEYLNKWGINLMTQSFAFNERFHQYHRFNLVEAFFKDPSVAENLKIWDQSGFKEAGIVASEVEVKQLPCTIRSMSFFNRIQDPKNEITYESGSIRQTYDNYINGILVADYLRTMILDEESDKYNLYPKNERDEFIFRIFQMLVLGGEYCQYESDLKVYLDLTKCLYKTFIRIAKIPNVEDFTISTLVFEVIAKKDKAYFPNNPENIQNIGFLFIDPLSQEVTTLLHQY